MRTKSSTISTTIIGLLCICAIGICTDINNTSALTYQTKVDNSFTINPSVSISLSSSELKIEDLTPGSASDSNTIRLTVETNNNYGYTISSTAGDGDTYTDTTLKHKDDSVSDSFTSLATNASIAASEGDNKAGNITAGYWGYSYNLNNTTWSNYSGLPYFNSGSAAELYSTDTNASSTIDFKIAANAKDTQIAGEYNNIINFITTVTPKPLIYMQNATLADCGETMYDSRDEKGGETAYTTAKIGDRCWMTTNLNLAGGTELSSSDTNVTDAYISSFSTGNNLAKTGDGKLKLPTSAETGFNNNNYSYVYNSNSINCGDNSPCYSYYSWDAATLGSGRSVATDNTDAPHSICPKGWHLPNTRTGTDSASDFRALMVALGGNGATQTYGNSSTPKGSVMSNALQISPNNFLLAGDYGNNSFGGGGSRGGYWSATSSDNASSARYLYFNGDYIYSAGSVNRYGGVSTRCVLGP